MSQKITEILSQILNDAAGESIKIHTLQFDPERTLDEQIHEFVNAAEAAHRAECKACADAYEREQAEAIKKSGAAPTQDTAPRDRVLAGYMAFDGQQPIHNTFDVNHAVVAEGIERFVTSPHAKVLPKGVVAQLHVRPVYAD